MNGLCRSLQPAGISPRQATPFSLLRQRKGGKRKAPMRTVALGANCDGGAWAHTDTSPHLTATGRTTKAPGVPVVPGTANHHLLRSEEQTPNRRDGVFGARWGSIHRREPVMVCSGLVGRYSGQLSGQVFAVPGGVWEPCEPAVQSRAARGGVRAFSAFLFPPFLWRSKEKGVGVQGLKTPAGCHEQAQGEKKQ